MGSIHSRLIVAPQLSRRGQVINIPKPIMPAVVQTPQAAAHARAAAPIQAAVAAPQAIRHQAATPALGAAAVQVGAPLGTRLLVQQHCNSPAVVVNRPRLPPKREVKKKGPTYITPDVAPTDLEAIRNLRGIGARRLLVILGNGPSLSEIDPVPLTIEPNIDLMTINKPDSRVWPTRYWAFFDQSQLFRHRDLWSVYNGYIFNSTSIQQRRPGSIQFKNLHDMGFSLDLTSGLNIGRSSVYAAMQIGLWMGFEHIYILGCDMSEVDGKLHFYGRNPDVEPDVRKARFDAEANYYEHAATILPETVRRQFTFCSSYNPYPFVEKYGRLDHQIAVAEIVSKAHELATRTSRPEAA